MNNVCVIICFLVGVLIFSLIRSHCSCDVTEGLCCKPPSTCGDVGDGLSYKCPEGKTLKISGTVCPATGCDDDLCCSITLPDPCIDKDCGMSNKSTKCGKLPLIGYKGISQRWGDGCNTQTGCTMPSGMSVSEKGKWDPCMGMTGTTASCSTYYYSKKGQGHKTITGICGGGGGDDGSACSAPEFNACPPSAPSPPTPPSPPPPSPTPPPTPPTPAQQQCISSLPDNTKYIGPNKRWASYNDWEKGTSKPGFKSADDPCLGINKGGKTKIDLDMCRNNIYYIKDINTTYFNRCGMSEANNINWCTSSKSTDIKNAGSCSILVGVKDKECAVTLRNECPNTN